MRCWCGYLSGARCRLFAYCPAGTTASQDPIISCLIYIQPGFTFLVQAYPGYTGKAAVKWCSSCSSIKKGKGSPYSITERRVPEPAGDVSHKSGGRLPLLSTRPAVTPATLKRAATNFAAWWTEAQWVWTVCVCLQLLPTASWLQFEPGPFCAWVQHANHSVVVKCKPFHWQYSFKGAHS